MVGILASIFFADMAVGVEITYLNFTEPWLVLTLIWWGIAEEVKEVGRGR